MSNRINSESVDVAAIIDDISMTSFQRLVIFLCGIIAMLDGFDTQAIAFVAPAIAVDWGVAKSEFGPVFSAALVGLAIGAFTLGSVADRVGRRLIVIISVAGFGGFSLLTAYAQNMDQILLLRFLTGLGLGGAMPNIITLTTEYSPRRLRTLMVVIMFSGFPLGALLGGLVSAQLVEIFSWRSVFIFGGVLPLALIPILLWLLPESLPFLVSRNNEADRRRALGYLRKITNEMQIEIEDSANFVLPDKENSRGKVSNLFSDQRALATVMLWGIFFTNLLMFYFLIMWLPAVLVEAGLPINLAILTAVLLNAGSIIGGVTLGRLVDMKGPFKVLTLNYIMAGIFAVSIGSAAETLGLVASLVFCAGFCVGGGQLVANGLAASFYPPEIRSTGIGWALGFGRMGAIIGPIIGGFLVSLEFNTQQLFIAVAIPGFLASTAVFFMGRSPSGQNMSS